MRYVAVVLAFTLSCGGPLDPGGASLDGRWSGTSGNGVAFTLDLDQAGSVLSGSGEADLGGDLSPAELEVAGTFEEPEFRMTLTPDRHIDDLEYTGSLQSGRLVGGIIGSGFAGSKLVLERK